MAAEIKKNVLLLPYTVFKIGGPADFFCEVKNKEELKDALTFAREKNIPVLVLGGGSNILISDGGFRGLAVLNNISGVSAKTEGEFSEITLGAGEIWDDFVKFAVERGLSGVECLSGIPGKAGAALMQNIGAYGQSMDKTFVRATVVDIKTGEEKFFKKEECGFGYRTSRFKKEDRGKYAIADVTFLLKPGDAVFTYHDLKNYFDGASKKPALTDVRNAVLEIRNKKGMLVLSGENFFKSAGSFFTNPIVSKEICGRLMLPAQECNAKDSSVCRNPWYWEQKDGNYKISAACLMNLAGFKKGEKADNVGISPHHTLALVNYGGASAAEVMAFAGKIRTEIKNKFNIDLEIEPDII